MSLQLSNVKCLLYHEITFIVGYTESVQQYNVNIKQFSKINVAM